MIFSLERGFELTARALQIGRELDAESHAAASNHSLDKLKYINQKAIVLKKIMQVISASITRSICNGEYDEEDI